MPQTTGILRCMEESQRQQSSSLLSQALGLVRDLAVAPKGELERLKNQAAKFIVEFDEHQSSLARVRHLRPAPERAADAWILDMFQATESAISREQLLRDFLQRYVKERNLRDNEHHAGPWLLVFERDSDSQGTDGIAGQWCAGLHRDAFDAQCVAWLPKAGDDPFLDMVFKSGGDIDGWHAPWFSSSLNSHASPLFDALLDVGKRWRGESDYWVSAVCLPGFGRESTHGVFLLHPNAGTLLDPVPSATMRQDIRLLLVLALAWRQLEHQIKGLARLTEEDRRVLLRLLAPGIMHHEIGAAMDGLRSQSANLFNLIKPLALANRDIPALDAATRLTYAMARQTQRLFDVTDAFNGLDRRAAVEPTDLNACCQQVRLLLNHRLGHLGVDLAWDEAVFSAQALRTDIVLLVQTLVNVCSNALNAFAEGQTLPPRRIAIELSAAKHDGLELLLLNNGPPIKEVDARLLFQRGYTTRREGHGQGLYLSRLIARYLGGNLEMIAAARLVETWTVGFRLTIERELQASQGVAQHG
jgi:signal transduction histidine kinase